MVTKCESYCLITVSLSPYTTCPFSCCFISALPLHCYTIFHLHCFSPCIFGIALLPYLLVWHVHNLSPCQPVAWSYVIIPIPSYHFLVITINFQVYLLSAFVSRFCRVDCYSFQTQFTIKSLVCFHYIIYQLFFESLILLFLSFSWLFGKFGNCCFYLRLFFSVCCNTSHTPYILFHISLQLLLFMKTVGATISHQTHFVFQLCRIFFKLLLKVHYLFLIFELLFFAFIFSFWVLDHPNEMHKVFIHISLPICLRVSLWWKFFLMVSLCWKHVFCNTPTFWSTYSMHTFITVICTWNSFPCTEWSCSYIDLFHVDVQMEWT